MTTSSTSRLALAGSLALALCGPGNSVAADIDLYAAGGSADSAPNLLFFLDNSSNWSASSQAWSKADVLANCTTIYGSGTDAQKLCAQYTETVFGSNTSLVQGQVELRALKLVLNELVCSTSGSSNLKVNIGIMLFNPAGTADSNSGVSSYIRHAVAAMDATKCKVLIDDLDNIDAKITTPDFKGPSSAEYGAPLYEAFKYFGGFTNPAGVKVSGDNTAGSPTDETHFGPKRYGLKTPLEDPEAFTDSGRTTYKSPIEATNSCGKNFIVLIGNTWPNQEYGTDTGAPKYPTNLLMQRLSYDPGSQIYPVPLPNSAKTNVRFADEWAKFLYTTDVSDAPGQQNLLMYTVDVYNKSADAKQGELLKSMADTNGPGGHFKVGGDIKALVDAIKNILSRITAVNSVFASASLPVSVNAQGTFLNQIFMGVFRPDDKSQQRWYGNLKQYQLALSGNTLTLVDAKGTAAVDANSTGFINSCATSFWTGDSSNYWEAVVSQPSACLTTPYSIYSDAPDGPLVERGAAAQKLRAADPAKRNIRTCAKDDCSGSLVDFNTTTMSTLNATLVDWVRGQNNGDGFTDATGTTYSSYGKDSAGMRPTAHGEVVHSRPLAVNYGVSGAENVVVFYGAGDGMLRAVDGNQTGTTAGSELWGFIAPEHWSALDRVRTNSPLIAYPSTPAFTPAPQPKTYFFDGAIGGYQERTATSVNKLWIYPTMRRGGRSVYAFDVTNRPGASSQPTLMWRYSDKDEPQMGESWSTPLAFRVQGRTEPLLVFGAGYHTCEDSEDAATACTGVTTGRGIVVMDAKDGKSETDDYRFIDPGSDAGRFVADMALVDVNGDGYTDVIYAVDTRGNVWRINTSDPTSGYTGYAGGVKDWPVVKVAVVSQWDGSVAERRKFLYAPSTVVLGNQVMVLVGTGDREKPLVDSQASQVKNRFYGIRDNVTVTKDVKVVIGYGDLPIASATQETLFDVTKSTPIDPALMAKYHGWFRDLVTQDAPYEQVVTTPLTIAGVTYFSTFQAKNIDPKASSCLKSTARAYRVDFQTGTQFGDLPLTETFLSPGFPPSPVGGVVKIGNQSVPFVIGGSGPTVLSPTKVTPAVKPHRKPIYRYQRIDG